MARAITANAISRAEPGKFTPANGRAVRSDCHSRANNTAAVMVTATLPPFAQPGMHIDVTAAAMGDAANLQGGLLLMTGLKGIDGQVYAVSQGSVVTGGFVAGRAGNGQTVNHPTVGRVPGGATMERGRPRLARGRVKLQLRCSRISLRHCGSAP